MTRHLLFPNKRELYKRMSLMSEVILTKENCNGLTKHFGVLKDTLDERLKGREVILYGYADFTNTGDQALWIALVRYLEKNNFLSNSTCLHVGPACAKKEIFDRVLVFPGGGSLGNRYGSSRRRVEVLERSRDTSFVQMPVSTTFADDEHLLDRLRRAYSSEGITFCRDRKSQEEAKKNIGIDAFLVPDLVETLPSFEEFHSGESGELVFKRRDGEAKTPNDTKNRGFPFSFDWEDLDSLYPCEMAFNKVWKKLVLSRRVPQLIRDSDLLSKYRMNVAKEISLLKTSRALAFLSFFENVITDRLHGVILSKKLGINVRYSDNDHGKIARYVETWSAYYKDVDAVDGESKEWFEK